MVRLFQRYSYLAKPPNDNRDETDEENYIEKKIHLNVATFQKVKLNVLLITQKLIMHVDPMEFYTLFKDLKNRLTY